MLISVLLLLSFLNLNESVNHQLDVVLCLQAIVGVGGDLVAAIEKCGDYCLWGLLNDLVTCCLGNKGPRRRSLLLKNRLGLGNLVNLMMNLSVVAIIVVGGVDGVANVAVVRSSSGGVIILSQLILL